MNNPVNFSGTEWQSVSKSCKSLIRKMLTKKPEERISALEALNHEWMIKFTSNLE
jgi:serine/threonine protein kinase